MVVVVVEVVVRGLITAVVVVLTTSKHRAHKHAFTTRSQKGTLPAKPDGGTVKAHC